MATYYHANGGGNGGGNDWGSWIPIIVLFCIPTPVTWIIALIWLASKLRGGGKRGKNWQGGVKRHPYDIERERQAFVYGDAGRAMPFATAVELIHSYSLVHDDLPCMDDSPLRRGKPSVHAAFGEDMALLAGDALLTLAFEVMLRADNRQAIPAESVLAAALFFGSGAGGSAG